MLQLLISSPLNLTTLLDNKNEFTPFDSIRSSNFQYIPANWVSLHLFRLLFISTFFLHHSDLSSFVDTVTTTEMIALMQ